MKPEDHRLDFMVRRSSGKLVRHRGLRQGIRGYDGAVARRRTGRAGRGAPVDVGRFGQRADLRAGGNATGWERAKSPTRSWAIRITIRRSTPPFTRLHCGVQKLLLGNTMADAYRKIP
jgi:hypothetical protein